MISFTGGYFPGGGMGLFPQTQVLKDLFDDLRLVNKADDAHFPLVFGTGQRVCFVDLSDEVGPTNSSPNIASLVLRSAIPSASILPPSPRGCSRKWPQVPRRRRDRCVKSAECPERAPLPIFRRGIPRARQLVRSFFVTGHGVV